MKRLTEIHERMDAISSEVANGSMLTGVARTTEFAALNREKLRIEQRMSITFTHDDDPAQLDPFMRCTLCGENLCTVEEGDSLDTILAVGDEHVCEGPTADEAVCDECDATIPNVVGGSLLNRHHDRSCSLYAADNA